MHAHYWIGGVGGLGPPPLPAGPPAGAGGKETRGAGRGRGKKGRGGGGRGAPPPPPRLAPPGRGQAPPAPACPRPRVTHDGRGGSSSFGAAGNRREPSVASCRGSADGGPGALAPAP